MLGKSIRTGRQGGLQPGLDFSGFLIQPKFVQFCQHTFPRAMQSRPIGASGQQRQSLLDVRQANLPFPLQKTRAPGLQEEQGRARPACYLSGLR